MPDKIPYWQKLQDRRWQQRRLEILGRDNFICQSCKDEEDKSRLDVHHKFYIKGKEPWEYGDSALVTLCCGCHKIAQEYINAFDVEIKSYFSAEALFDLAAGIYKIKNFVPPEVLIETFEEIFKDDDLIRDLLQRRLSRKVIPERHLKAVHGFITK